MDQPSATALFATLDDGQRLRMIANLSYQLTIIGRDTYGSRGAVKDARRLRAINEIQHRLSTAMRALTEGGDQRGLAGDALAALFFAQRDDETLARLLAFAFEQAATAVLGSPLPRASAV